MAIALTMCSQRNSCGLCQGASNRTETKTMTRLLGACRVDFSSMCVTYVTYGWRLHFVCILFAFYHSRSWYRRESKSDLCSRCPCVLCNSNCRWIVSAAKFTSNALYSLESSSRIVEYWLRNAFDYNQECRRLWLYRTTASTNTTVSSSNQTTLQYNCT